ncbi:hypothetical protein D3C80_2150870 [compost metagenome]
MSIQVPNGMKEVSREEFFEALYADKRDIMPSVSESEDYSVWSDKSRNVWGYTYPGWKYPRGEKGYFIKK